MAKQKQRRKNEKKRKDINKRSQCRYRQHWATKKGIFTSKNLALNMQYDEGKFAWLLKSFERMLVGKSGYWRSKVSRSFRAKNDECARGDRQKNLRFRENKITTSNYQQTPTFINGTALLEHPPNSEKVLVSVHETQGGSKTGESKAKTFVAAMKTSTDDKALFSLQYLKTFPRTTSLASMLRLSWFEITENGKPRYRL